MQNSMGMFSYSVFDLNFANLLFKLKFGTRNNLNMQNLMVFFLFHVLKNENLVFGQNWSKKSDCQFKVKIGA